MRCPRCKLEQKEAAECAGCGILIARARRGPRPRPASTATARGPGAGPRAARHPFWPYAVVVATLAVVGATVAAQRAELDGRRANAPTADARLPTPSAADRPTPNEAPPKPLVRASPSPSPSPSPPGPPVQHALALDLGVPSPETVTDELILELQDRLARDPFHDELRIALARSLLAMGEQRREARRLVEAVTYYDRALERDPGHDPTLLRLAMVQMELERWNGAQAALDRVGPEVRNTEQYHSLLGRLRYAREDLQGAMVELRAAQAVAEAPSDYDAGIARLERELAAHGDARSLQGRRFKVVFDGAENVAAGDLVVQALEAVYAELKPEFGLPDFAVNTVLYSRQSYADVTGAPHWTGGLYDGKIRVPIGGLTRIDEPYRRLLKHELAHAFIDRKGGPAVPRWLHEGLAQYHAGQGIERFDITAAERRTIASDTTMTEPRLLYAQALYRVEAMMDRYGSRKVLDLLDAMRRSASFETALRQVTNERTEVFFASFAE